jgi:predicted transcriptional regulator
MTKDINIDTFKELYYEKRLPVDEISEKLKIDKSTIYYFLNKNNLPNRRKHQSTLNEDLITKELLLKLYIIDNKTIKEVAEEIGLSQTTTHRLIKQHNIPNKKILFNKDELYKKYWVENKDMYEIAKELGVAQSTISVAMRDFKIPIRSNHPVINHITGDILYKKYIEEKLGTDEIAKELGVAQSTIFNLLKVNNIQTRTQAETQRGKVGSLARAWKGGLSYRPYCYKFNKPLKEEIRKNFGRVCFICEKTQRDEEKNLCIHHVNYDKSQECDRNCILIPLCNFCHLRTNGNRWYYFNLLFHYWARNLEICLSFPGGFPEFYPHYFEIV